MSRNLPESQVDGVRGYTRNQEGHHRRRTLQEEFRALLKKLGIAYEEGYTRAPVPAHARAARARMFFPRRLITRRYIPAPCGAEN